MKLLNALSRLSDLAIAVAMAVLIIIMILVTVDVTLRNVLSSSIPGAVEISEMLQGTVVFLGMAATLKTGNHIAADLIVEKFSIRSQATIDVITGSLSLVVMGFMTFALLSAATGPGAEHEVTMLLGIPTQPFWFIAAFGIGLMCIELLRFILRCAANLARNRS